MAYADMRGNTFFSGVELIMNRVTTHSNWFTGHPDKKGRVFNIVGGDPGDAEAVARAAVDADLAIAFEQRTANLISVLSSVAVKGLDREALRKEIHTRLGLEEKKNEQQQV